MVEDLVSRVLLELFRAVVVKGVVVRFMPQEHESDEILTASLELEAMLL